MDSLIETMQAEIEILRERVRQLEALLTPDGVAIRPEWQLVNAERRIFAALTLRDVVSKELLYEALYSDRRDLDVDPDVAVVESHVSKLKKKLQPFGVVITSARFVGYSLQNRAAYQPGAVARSETAGAHG